MLWIPLNYQWKMPYTFGDEIMIALDCAAAEFFVNGKYDYSKFEGETGKIRSSAEQVDYLAELAANYQLSRLKMEWMKMIGMDGKCLNKMEIKCSW
jgi:enolase